MTPRIRIAVAAGFIAAGLTAVPAHAAPSDGYVRLAHLSPDTPAVDVYLYSAGKTTPRLVLEHVGYGALSPYQRLAKGSYKVAMRPADAPASSKPVLETTVDVAAGSAHTVAGMGPYKGIKLEILDDNADLEPGHAGLRVLAASLKSPTVDVKAPGLTIDDLAFPEATEYRQTKSGNGTLKVTGTTGKSATETFPLDAGSLYTAVVLDGPGGLKILPVKDTVKGKIVPNGAIDTGLGGLASRESGPSPLWLIIPAAVFASYLIRRRIVRC